jgi:hypothetical protein
VVRRVLLLLIACPMLLPPGFCICKFVDVAPPTAAAKAETAPKQGCCCCHRHAKPKAPASPHPDAPSAPTKTPDEQHVPACPAHPCWAIFRAATLPGSHNSALAAAVLVNDPLLSWEPSCPTLNRLIIATSDPPFSSAPLFLRC